MLTVHVQQSMMNDSVDDSAIETVSQKKYTISDVTRLTSCHYNVLCQLLQISWSVCVSEL